MLIAFKNYVRENKKMFLPLKKRYVNFLKNVNTM